MMNQARLEQMRRLMARSPDAEDGWMTVTALAELMRLSRPYIAQGLAQLQRQGQVESRLDERWTGEPGRPKCWYRAVTQGGNGHGG